MFGFNDSANLDEGSVWPVAYALKELTAADEANAADEAKIGALVKKAVSRGLQRLDRFAQQSNRTEGAR